MSEGIAGAGIAEKTAIGILRSLGGDDHAVSVAFHTALYPREKLLPVEGYFREQDNVRRIPFFFGRKTRGRGDPACMASHDLENKDLRRRGAH